MLNEIYNTQIRAWFLFLTGIELNNFHIGLSCAAIVANIFYIGYKIYKEEKK